MAVDFTYKVRDRTGRLVEGQLEADSMALVATRLREMGYTPISIEPRPLGALNRDVRIPVLSNRVRLKDLAVATRQLATMINAGLTLVRSLGILAEQTTSKELRSVLGAVRLDVEHGSSLSEALSRHPNAFSPLYVSMVRAGEIGGTIDLVLLEIARTVEKQLELRRRVRSAMTYPVIALVIVLMLLAAMLLFVVPSFKRMYDSLHGQLPVPTRILLDVSHVATHLFYIVIPAIIALAVAFGYWKRSPRGKPVWDRFALRPPVFGKLVHKISLARMSRTLASLVKAGVPILESLDIVAETCGNTVVGGAVHGAKAAVKQGETISRGLGQHPVIPQMVVHMISSGEQTGALDTMLDKVAEFYEGEVAATVDALASLIEPLLIVIMGAIVGAMVIALYLPMFNIIKLIH